MNEFLQRLKQRKLVQWAVAYVAAAFALLQGIDIVAQRFAWPDAIERILIIASCIGFFVVLVLAWYHGERGAQKVTGTELLILALLLSLGGVFLWRFASAARAPSAASTVEPAATLASSSPAVAIPAKSIAVLPFENLSADKDNAYFASGMQDMILTKLAAIGELKVISRTSTERYKSHPDDLKVIAQQLGVTTILEGSVQKAGDQVLINVQLIDAATDNHLWAEAYPRTLANIFGVEGEVAENVADALKAKLLPAESARVESVPTKNQAAYDLFLKGKYLFNKLQTSSAKDPVTTGNSASEFFQRATRADPEFALAYAWWSYLESYLHWYGVDTRSEAIEEARTAAEKALALQPDLPEAHLAMGYVHYWCHRDYPAALKEFEIARASLPNNADVLAAIGYVHRRQGAIPRGIPELEQAMVLDPRDSTLPREIANSHTALRQYAEADQYYARSLAIVPDDLEAQEQRATNALFRGDLEAASRMLTAIPADTDSQGSVSLLRFKLAMIQRRPDAALAAIAHSPDWLMTRWEHSVAPIGLLRGQALAMKGETVLARDAFLDAEKQLKELLANPGQVADANSYLGLVYAGLGEKELALKAARTAVEMLPMSRDVIVGIFYLDRLAQTEAQVGAASSAIDHLDQLMSSAGGETLSIATLRIDPAWDSLRKDPRFQKLLDGSDSTGKAATPST